MAETDEIQNVEELDTVKQLPDTEPIGEMTDLETVKKRIDTRISEATNFFNEVFSENFKLFYNQYRIMKTEPK